MNKITSVTRKRILDAIAGYEWHGELSEPEFLNRIFDLHALESTDLRYKDMYGDIIQHRVNNNDYDNTWFITDSRLNLLNIADDMFVKFILLTIDPLIVSSPANRDTFVHIYNDFLINDGYELIIGDYVSGEPVYKISEASANDLLYKLLARLQAGCVDISTNGSFSDIEFLSIMQRLRKEQKLYSLLPQFVLTSHQTINIRKKMQDYAQHYADRRTYINEQFHPAFQYLETINGNTYDTMIKTEDSDDGKISADNAEVLQNKTPKIFISHSSKDKKVAEMLVDLIEKMGIPDSAIYCTSADGLGVSLRENIYASMRKQFDEHNLFVLFLLSHNYYQSAACLNEMGATWILKLPEISVLLPGFDFSQIEGAVDSRNIGIKLDAEEAGGRLTELREQLCKFMNINIPSSASSLIRWESKRNAFIDGIKKISQNINGSSEKTGTHPSCISEKREVPVFNQPQVKNTKEDELSTIQIINCFELMPREWENKIFQGAFYVENSKHSPLSKMSEWLCSMLGKEYGKCMTFDCFESESKKRITVYAEGKSAIQLAGICKKSDMVLQLKTIWFQEQKEGLIYNGTQFDEFEDHFVYELIRIICIKKHEPPQSEIPF